MKTFVEYFRNIHEHNGVAGCIHSCPELMECVRQLGFLPLLESGIQGYAAESMMAEECRFIGMAFVAVEGFCGARRRLRLWQLLCRQSGIYQP